MPDPRVDRRQRTHIRSFMATVRKAQSADFEVLNRSATSLAIAQQVAKTFVHRLYPSFRKPAYLDCPDAAGAHAVLDAIEHTSLAKGVSMERVDLRPAPAQRLEAITTRLCRIGGGNAPSETPPGVQFLVLDGFDVLEGEDIDAPTYPFRSEFQFDHAHLRLFLGRDWRRLLRLFATYRLPLYQAAEDLTPGPWQQIPRGMR